MKYLAPYIFRVAISNKRILQRANGMVTFRYEASGTGEIRLCTILAEEFIRRFLQYVLPKGFVKVRYYGFFSSGNRHKLHRVRQLLGARCAGLTADQQTKGVPQEGSYPCPGAVRLCAG